MNTQLEAEQTMCRKLIEQARKVNIFSNQQIGQSQNIKTVYMRLMLELWIESES